MSASSTSDIDVLIVGAGPTGLVLALWLARMGVRVRIIDKTAEPGTTSRALAVQGRTLEFYAQFGFANEVVERGRQLEAVNFWVAQKKAARVAIGNIGVGISPFAEPLMFPQDEHERLLIAHLSELGVAVERQTELVSFEDTSGHVVAHLKSAAGAEQTCEAAYLAGCDGVRSKVRELLGIGFPGGVYEHLFYIADVDASGPAINGEIHVGLDKTDFLAIFPLKTAGRARLIGTVRAEFEHSHEQLSWHDVSKGVVEWMRVNVERVNWFSTYHVHHRVANQFRRGRAFLLGDAAHVHSPVGGQGMNTGIGDAVNLAWKLAAVIQGRADESVRDSYEPERIAFARRLVETTDRAFTGVTSSRVLARTFRLDLVPRLMPLLLRITPLRQLAFRTVSQTGVNYRGSSLSAGHVGAVQGGDRLPWVQDANGPGRDNFAPLMSLDWQVHIYGEATPEVRQLCDDRKLPLHEFPWRPAIGRTGLVHNALYLVRPDGYIALAEPEPTVALLRTYLDSRNLAPLRAT